MVLERGNAHAVISQDTLTCERFAIDGWNVLGVGGARVHLSETVATLTTEWHLAEDGLSVDLRVLNTSPCFTSFALSVRVELNAIGERVQAIVPAEDVWPHDLSGPAEPVVGAFDLRRPRWIDEPLDARYTRRHFANLRTSVAVLEPSAGREAWLYSSADFSELWVSLDRRGAGVLETALCPPAPPGAVRRLAPGESWRGSVQLSVRGVH